MKYLLFLLLIFGVNCYAQEEQYFKSHCDKTDKIFNDLKELGERVLLAGKGPENSTGIMTVWINPSNNGWTILVTYPDKTCIIGWGRELTLRQLEKSKQNVPKSLL